MNWKAMTYKTFNLGFILIVFSACVSKTSVVAQNTASSTNTSLIKTDNSIIKTGAENTEEFISLLQGKKVGVVANMTSTIGSTHLVDSLLKLGIHIKIVFSPEHGFRGDKEYGEHVKHDRDKKTGLPLFSLHGKTKKPSVESLKGIQMMVFDIQDVGVRFYTYISTLHFVMEACAEANIPLIVLDRPNPNAFYIGGPVLESAYKSFVGKHPVPVVYGMTIGEYAQMINGEKWLANGVQCSLKVVALKNWNHRSEYILPIPPSPNLPNQQSIYLYPHLCFFEGTDISLGRGTEFPFQIYGHPTYTDTSFSFTPISIKGKSTNPPQLGVKCFGKDLSTFPQNELKNVTDLQLRWFLDAYNKTKVPSFFNADGFINLLAGNGKFKEQVLAGKSEEEIRQSWQADLDKFKQIRSKYLLYP